MLWWYWTPGYHWLFSNRTNLPLLVRNPESLQPCSHENQRSKVAFVILKSIDAIFGCKNLALKTWCFIFACEECVRSSVHFYGKWEGFYEKEQIPALNHTL